MAGLVPAIHVLLFKAAKTWMPGTRPGRTTEGLRRQHRAADELALLQVKQRLIGLGERHRRDRDRRNLLSADEVEQLAGLPEIADIAALDRDRLDRDQRQGPRRAAAEQADDDELAALGQAVKTELRGLRVADQIDHGADRTARLLRELRQRIGRHAVDGCE